MFVRTPFNYDGDVVSHKSGLDCSDAPTRAQQHFRDECDINVLVARFARTGLPEAPQVPSMAQFDEVLDFQSAMQTIIDARAAFGQLPSNMRARFQNDPGQFLAFVHDDANRDEAVRLGLVQAPPVPDPVVSLPPSGGDSSTVS